MSCLYCGRQTGWRRDTDFCSTAHRKLYHQRLRQGLDRISVEEPTPVRTADFIKALPPGDVRHQPAAGAGDLRRTPLPTRLPAATQVRPWPLPGRSFFPALPAGAAAPAAVTAACAGNTVRARNRLRLPNSFLPLSRHSFAFAPAAHLHIPVAVAVPARVADSAGHASARATATHLRLPLPIVSSGTAQVESAGAARPVSLPAAAPPDPGAASPARDRWTPFKSAALVAPPLDLKCLADVDSLGAIAPAAPIFVRPRAVRAPETAPAPRQGKLVPFSARSGVRWPAVVRPLDSPAPDTAGPASAGADAASGPDERVSFTLQPWVAPPAPAGIPALAAAPAGPAVSASEEFLDIQAREADSAPAVLAAGPLRYHARRAQIAAERAELPAAVGMPLARNAMPALSCAANLSASPSRVAAFAVSGAGETRVPPLAVAVRGSDATRRMPITGSFFLRGAASSRPGRNQPVPPAATPRHPGTDPAIPAVPRDIRTAAMAARTDRLLKLECRLQNIPAAPVRKDKTYATVPRIAVRKPALTLDAFLEGINPNAPRAPRLAAVRVIAPKPAARPSAATVNWWYRQAKAVAAALAVGTALWLSVGQAGNAVLGNNRLGKAIAKRAAVQFSDDFRAGLNSWKGNIKGWSYQKDGYIRPGDFAIFAPSQKNPDYRLDFLTLVERNSVDWSVRARDPRNYYAMKLAVVKPGPRPEMMLVRYPVIDGRKGTPVQVPVTAPLSQDTPYVVSVRVNGDSFTASVEGQPVDTWTDHALASGGVAVFSEAGARARLYWLKVTSNDDFIGKLCAFLAGKRDGEVAARGPRSSWPGPWFALSLTPGASMSVSPEAAGSGNGG